MPLAGVHLDENVCAARRALHIARHRSPVSAGSRSSASTLRRRLPRPPTFLPETEVVGTRAAQLPPVLGLIALVSLAPARLHALARGHSVTVTRTLPLPGNELQQPIPLKVKSKT